MDQESTNPFMRSASAALQELELLHHLSVVRRDPTRQTTHPALMDVEDNLVRLLGAAMALMGCTPFFLDQSGPKITYAKFAEAAVELEARNRALFLDATVTDRLAHLVKTNMVRISQISVVGRVGLHLERLELLVSNEVERKWIVQCLGPSADSIFLLGTRIVNLLQDAEQASAAPLSEILQWELLMVDGSLHAALEEFHHAGVLSRTGRRYVQATIWAFQVARDALVAVLASPVIDLDP